MTIDNWNDVYNHNVRWAIRRLTDDSLKVYKDKREDWVNCLILLNEFEDKLFKDLSMANNIISYKDYLSLCHYYINEAKKTNNRTVGRFFFNLIQDGQIYFKEYKFPDECFKYLKKATKEEIEQARKDFSYIEENFHGEKRTHKHTFSDDANVLEYRGERFIIDNEWGDAWLKDKNKIYNFQLIWDWYFPIDEYIDLEKGWDEE